MWLITPTSTAAPASTTTTTTQSEQQQQRGTIELIPVPTAVCWAWLCVAGWLWVALLQPYLHICLATVEGVAIRRLPLQPSTSKSHYLVDTPTKNGQQPLKTLACCTAQVCLNVKAKHVLNVAWWGMCGRASKQKGMWHAMSPSTRCHKSYATYALINSASSVINIEQAATAAWRIRHTQNSS